jgi:hypothetical protein
VNGGDVRLEQIAEGLRIAPAGAIDERRDLGWRRARRVSHGPHTIYRGRAHARG